MIDIALRNDLINDANLNVSSVYPERLPQNTNATAIVYQINNGFAKVQQGSNLTVVEHNVQLDVYGTSYSDVRNLVSKLLTKYNGYAGGLDTLDVAGSYVRSVQHTFEDDTRLYRGILDIELHVKF